MKHSRQFALRFGVVLLFLILGVPSLARTVDDLREKISERQRAIEELEREISAYQKELEKTGAEAKSLQEAIRQLDLTRKKLLADIRVTEERIRTSTFSIEKLEGEITEKEKHITENENVIAGTLREVREAESTTFVEFLLGYDRLSSLWETVDLLARFQNRVYAAVLELKTLKNELTEKKTEVEAQRKNQTRFRSELGDRNQIVLTNQKEKSSLLSTTKNKESSYQRILKEKFALRDAFERELLEFESQLRFEIDPTRLPEIGTRILSWPLDTVRITQYFGNTPFARSNPGVYNGQGHNGIDLGGSVGTPIKTALGGKVAGTGDTDPVCPNASYGKWVLVEHGNGLSTLYAHLSLIKVSEGEEVSTESVLGYVGNTGYSTGPHLHFTVFATQGVRIMTRKSRVCSGSYTMPVADLRAYLNPLNYL